MFLIKKILTQLNPFISLGQKRYGVTFPIVFMITWTVLLEFYAHVIVKNPDIVGLPAIIFNIVFIVYFSLRNGMRGGFVASVITILYYVYITYTHNYSEERLAGSINTIIALGGVYIMISAVIGWLKQRVDSLISTEKNARIHAEESRTRLEAILEQLPVGVMVLDKDGKLDMANKQTEILAGMKIPNFTLGKPGTYKNGNSKAVVTENGKPLKDEDWPLALSFATGKPVQKYISLKRDDGKELFLHITSSLIRNKKKNILGYHRTEGN
jgi:hypothetical protein